MAVVDEIAVKLGLKTADFKAALKDANADVKKFKDTGSFGDDEGMSGSLKSIKKQFGDVKQLLVAGGVATAVQQFFAMAIDRANQTTDALNTNAAAVREFGQGVGEVKNGVADLAVLAVGSFNKLGSAIGDAINIAKSFAQSGPAGFEMWAQAQEQVAASAAAAESAERSLADARKRNGAEFLAITKGLEDAEKKGQEQKLKGLDVYETERLLKWKLIDVNRALEKDDLSMIERRRLMLAQAQTQNLLEETIAQRKKEDAATQKKADDEAAARAKKKFDEDLAYGRESIKLDEQLRQIAFNKLTDAEKLGQLEKDRKVLVKEIRDINTDDNVMKADKVKLAALDEMIKKLKEIIALPATPAPPVVATVKEVEKLNEAWDGFFLKISNKGDVRNLTDTQLNALAQKLQSDLNARNDQRFTDPRYDPDYDVQSASLRLNLEAVRNENNLRAGFRQANRSFGAAGAEAAFSPEDFARLAQYLNPDQAKQQASDIGTIAGTLRNVFPGQAAGIR